MWNNRLARPVIFIAICLISGCAPPQQSTQRLIGPPDDYFPIPLGAWWDFGIVKIVVESTATLDDGRKVVKILPRAFGGEYIWKGETEVRSFGALHDTIGRQFLKVPLKVNDKWDHWYAGQESTITVPAGTFENAIKIRTSTSSAYFWLAPGVGLIKYGGGTSYNGGPTEIGLQAYGISIP